MTLSDYLHREPVRDWAEELLYTSLAAGHGLVRALGTPWGPHAGLCDNVWVASELIRDLEQRGWVKREGFEPGVSIGFLGIGGATSSGKHPAEFCWSTTSEGRRALLDLLEPLEGPDASPCLGCR
jgi:hypothetical protein